LPKTNVGEKNMLPRTYLALLYIILFITRFILTRNEVAGTAL